MFFNDRIFVFLGNFSVDWRVEVCLMFSLKKKKKEKDPSRKNRNDYVCVFFLVIMCEMIYIGSLSVFMANCYEKFLADDKMSNPCFLFFKCWISSVICIPTKGMLNITLHVK